MMSPPITIPSKEFLCTRVFSNTEGHNHSWADKSFGIHKNPYEVTTTSVAPTFAIPTYRKKVVVAPPKSNTAAFRLSLRSTSRSIKIFSKCATDLALRSERHPGAYANKDERLFAICLMMLAPPSRSATGETFNKSGRRTSPFGMKGLLLCRLSAEFWQGEKVRSKTIDQLLGYDIGAMTQRRNYLFYFVPNNFQLFWIDLPARGIIACRQDS